jgi:hypothetical protein
MTRSGVTLLGRLPFPKVLQGGGVAENLSRLSNLLATGTFAAVHGPTRLGGLRPIKTASQLSLIGQPDFCSFGAT